MGDLADGLLFVAEELDVFTDVRIGACEICFSFEGDVDVEDPVLPCEAIGDIFCVAAQVDIPGLEAYYNEVFIADIGHGVRDWHVLGLLANKYKKYPCQLFLYLTCTYYKLVDRSLTIFAVEGTNQELSYVDKKKAKLDFFARIAVNCC